MPDHLASLVGRLRAKATILPAVLVPVSLLLVTFHPLVLTGRILLPLDQLNTMFLPYSAHHRSVEVYNHFLYDVVTQFYPYKAITRNALLDRTLPWWNPNILGGYPQYAQTMAAHFDPTNVLLLCCQMPMAYQVQMLFQLIIAYTGMYLLLRTYGISQYVAIFFSASYMLNSLFVTILLQRSIVGSFCWVPYILIMLRRYDSTGAPYYLLTSGAFTALAFVGGTLQTSAYVVFVVLVVGLLSPREFRVRGPSSVIAVPCVVLIVGFGLSAAMWLPSIELFWLDLVQGGSRGTGSGHSYSLIERILSVPLLITFAFPELAGSVRAFDLTKIANATMAEFTGYVGLVPLVLGIQGSILGWRSRPDVRPYVVLIVAGLLIPIATPLYRFVYHRFFIVYMLGLLVVGALALDDLLRGRGDWLRVRKLLAWSMGLWLVVCIGVVAVNALVWFNYRAIHALAIQYVEANMARGQFASGNEAWMISRVDRMFEHFSVLSHQITVPLASGMIALLLLLLVSRTDGICFAIARVGLMVVGLLQLVLFAWSWLPMIDPDEHPLYPETHVTSWLQQQDGVFRVLPISTSAGHPVFPPNVLQMYGIETLSGYENLVPRTLRDLAWDQTNMRSMGLANVKYVITERQATIDNPDLVLVYADIVSVYENRRWQPRAFVAYDYEVAGDDVRALQRMRVEDFTPSKVLVFDGAEAQKHVESTDGSFHVHRMGSMCCGAIYSVETSSRGLLVVSENFYPGWKARVNGDEAPILRANYAMRAVGVPPGSSIVEFSFEPISWEIGKWVSVLTCLGCIVTVFVHRRRAGMYTGSLLERPTMGAT